MATIILDREIIIYIYDVENALFPNNDLFPDDDLYPAQGTLVIESSESESGIVEGTLNIEEFIADSSLIFGQCISNKFECELFNIPFDIAGKTIYVVAKENGTQIPLFRGTVDASTTDASNYDRKLVAYDDFYYKRDINVSTWWNTFWTDKTQTTLKTLRNSLLDGLGIVYYENTVLPNDNLVIKKGVDYTSFTFTDCLKMICELQGCFPNFDRMGSLDFVRIGGDTFDLKDKYEKNTATFQTYKTAKITGIQVYADSSNLSQSIGSEVNPYSITGNIFLLNMTANEITSCCTTLLNSIKDITYRPSTVPVILSDLDIMVGDTITSDEFETYVLKNQYSGSLLVNQTITSNAVGEYLSKGASSLNAEIIAGRKTSKLQHDLDTFKTEITDSLNDVESEITQTAKSITLGVSNKEGSATITVSITDNVTGDTTTKTADVKINADTISLTAKQVIELMSGGTLYLGGEKGVIIDGSNFSVDKDGNAEFKGSIESGSTITTPYFEVNGDGVVFSNGKSESEYKEYFSVNDNGASFSGAISTPYFTVDSNGASFTGSIESGSSISTPYFTANSNGATFKGSITSGSTIAGAKITGGSIEINKDSNHGLKINDNGILSASKDRGISCETSIYGGGLESNYAYFENYFHLYGGIEYRTMGNVNYLLIGNCTYDDSNRTVYVNATSMYSTNGYYITSPLDSPDSDGDILEIPMTYGRYIWGFNNAVEYLEVITSNGAYGINWWVSDIKLKDNIADTKIEALSKINNVRVIEFDWNGKAGHDTSHVDIGLSANQLEEIIPEAVMDIKQTKDSEFDSIKQINPNILTTYNLKAIQELSAEVDSLKSEIAELKKLIYKL